jgi:hypothetical protein
LLLSVLHFSGLFRSLHRFDYHPFCLSDREPLVRIELTTSSLPRKCSTTELQRLFYCRRRQSSKWSGRPGSNRPPEAWKATALPNELLPLVIYLTKNLLSNQPAFAKAVAGRVGRAGFEPTYS